MSRKFSSLKEVNDSKETWRLAVRVVDLWSVINSKGKEHLEMVIMDASAMLRILSNRFNIKILEKKVICFIKGVIVNCTLWESYRTKNLDFYHDEKNSGAIVIVLTHAMIKESQVNLILYFLSISFSNGWSGSKLLINEDIPEITEYLSKLPANEQTKKPSQSSKGMSLWSGASQFTPVESFVHKAKCISLSDLCKVKQDMLCVTVGTTQKFFVSKHGWFYYGCIKCSLKASDVNNPYKCSCGQNVEHAIPRYRVDIYVIDGESKFRFVFWDTDCVDIIGKSTDSIYKAMLEEGEDNPMIYPDELDMLLGKKMAFRAKVQPTFGQASVWKLSYDEEFTKEIEKDYITNEGDSIPLTQNPVVDRVNDSIESLSAYGENDPDKVVTNTPSKGSPITLDAGDSECQPYGATQLSGTKPSKKVKIESNA
ncbi:uncharacterized protein LOC131614617 [Vicia villosa]|uniref:uncharacterized protein LOC131614617 n=1 Tax=Vicia villosa TaxID=3911 RepID=UPI00273B9216|nr:uncharacterized protein LOC131614617 [Vicia villosa]